MFLTQKGTSHGKVVNLMSDKPSRLFWDSEEKERQIRQKVGVVEGQAGRSWSAAIGEKEVVGNVGFYGGGVGRGLLSILQSTSWKVPEVLMKTSRSM